jgi:2-amino-4-hydroxy-6-hydroxymethyldihydropteridine diphosphokinase
VTRVSDIQETAPLGQMHQPNYLNGVAEVRTELKPQELLRKLKATEAALGRWPASKWQARPIDLDLLLYGLEIINDSGLVVPHPEMHLRSFVLDGLCQLNPGLVHPLLKEPVSELAHRLGGGNFAVDPDVPQLVSVAGIIGVGKTTLAKKLAEVLQGEVLYEPYGTNPFLPQVYAGKCELALDSQLYFLVNRTEQLDRNTLPRHKVFVTDYVFDKELIYARRLLNPEQLKLYEMIFQPFAARVATPVLVIYLQDSPQACLERIHSRNRPYEQRISLEFLEALDKDYRNLFAGWRVCPVIRIPASRLTGYSEAVVEHVVRHVRAYIAGGANQ